MRGPWDPLHQIEALPRHLVVAFAELGIDEFTEWALAQLESHVRMAAGLVAHWRPELAAVEAFREFAQALDAGNPPTQPCSSNLDPR